MAAEYSFTWKIPDVSSWISGMRKSDPFLAGGCEWILVADTWEHPYEDMDCISLFLRCCSDSRAGEDGRRKRYAEYKFYVATERGPDGRHILGGGRRRFKVGGKGWGFKDCIPRRKFGAFEYVVDDALEIHAQEPASPDPYCYYDDDHQEGDSSDADTDQGGEDTADHGDTDADEQGHIQTDHQSDGASIEPSGDLTRLAVTGQIKLAAQEAPLRVQSTELSSDQVGCPAGPSTSRARLTSSNLIAQLSTIMSSNTKSPASSGSSSALLLQQQREKMARYLCIPLEAIRKTEWFEDVDQIARLIADHPSTNVDKANLDELLWELKEGVPRTMSIVESSRVTEASMAWVVEDLKARLFRRQRQLGGLEDEVFRLGEEERRLDGEIQQLVARKAMVGDRKKSSSDELDKAGEEAAREMEEVKEASGKRKRACEDKVAAEEKLGRLKTRWRELKQKLGM